MATAILVAGRVTYPLTKFLEDRGSYEIVQKYESLYAHREELYSGTFRADKLIYINQEPGMDVNKDMRILRDLLIGGGFFVINELVIFTLEEFVSGTDYFAALENELRRRAASDKVTIVPEFIVKEAKKPLNFDEIYTELLGVRDSSRITNTYDIVYRTRRGTEAKVVHQEENSRSMKVEPFSYSRVEAYDNMKISVDKTDSGREYVDSETINFDKIDKDLGSIEVPQPVKFKSLIVTGTHNSGITTIASALAVSASSAGNRVAYIDCTANKDIKNLLRRSRVVYDELLVSDILLDTHVIINEGMITLLSDFDLRSSMSIVHKLFYSLGRIDFDFIIIDCDIEILRELKDQLDKFKINMMVVSGTTKDSIEELTTLSIKVDEYDLMLNKIIDSNLNGPDLDAKDIRNILPKAKRVIHPIVFNDLALDGYLYTQLFGGEANVQ